MLYQRTPLPADIDYFLDGALDCDEISALCFNAITLLGDRKIVPSIVDAEPLNDRRLSLRNRRERALALDDYAHQLVSELASHEQAAFYASGMLREPLKLYGLADWLCSWNHEDETIGGCGKPYRDITRHDKNYDPTPRVRRHLYSPSAIRRYVKLEAQCVPYARRLAEPLSRLPIGKPDAAQLIVDLMQEQRGAYRETLMAARAKFEADLRRRYAGTESKGLTKVDRKAVTRAAAFAAGVIGPEQISAFLQGRPVLLQGQNVALEVTSRGEIARLGHGGLAVNLCTPAGDRLSGLCVYFDKTPVLDQVAAIALHLQAGCESELIDTGNLYAITPLGSRHPVVAARVKKMKTDPGRAQRDTDKNRKTAAQARYKADTLRIYFDAVATTVWGRNARRLTPFSDAILEQAETIAAERTAA